MSQRPTVAIVGTGFMGTSLGLALGDRGWNRVGWDTTAGACTVAESLGALDTCAVSLTEAVAEADVIIVCLPVGSTLELLAEVVTHAKAGSIITDIGSVKKPVVDAMRTLQADRADVWFVGGHPMCGGLVAGPETADGSIFQGATWVLCPVGGRSTGMPLLGRLISDAGSDAYEVDAATHDRVVALTSHTPFHVAQAMVAVAARDGAVDTTVLAAQGWRSLTERAAGNPEMWAQITEANAANIVDALRLLAGELAAVADRIASR